VLNLLLSWQPMLLPQSPGAQYIRVAVSLPLLLFSGPRCRSTAPPFVFRSSQLDIFQRATVNDPSLSHHVRWHVCVSENVFGKFGREPAVIGRAAVEGGVLLAARCYCSNGPQTPGRLSMIASISRPFEAHRCFKKLFFGEMSGYRIQISEFRL